MGKQTGWQAHPKVSKWAHDVLSSKGKNEVVPLHSSPISFPKAAILLVSDGDRDLWPDGILSPQITDFRLHCAESRANPKLPKLPCCGLFQLPVFMPLFFNFSTANRNWPWNPIGQRSRFFQRMTKGTPGDEVDGSQTYLGSFVSSDTFEVQFYDQPAAQGTQIALEMRLRFLKNGKLGKGKHFVICMSVPFILLHSRN